MQMLKMISSLVFLVQPLCALLRLLARPVAAIIRYVRPTTALTRACYVLLGITLLLGAWGAEQDGQRNYAIALAVTGAILLILRRVRVTSIQDDEAWPTWAEQAAGCPAPTRVQNDDVAQMPSDLLRSGWTRKGVAVNARGEPVLSDDSAAVAWSLCGAVNAVLEPGSSPWKFYVDALQAQIGHNLVRWNGDSGRTQDEVVAAALEAERRLEEMLRCV